MLRIRFFRTGRRNQPFFRLVVTDKRNAPQGGRFLEILGHFNPKTKEKGLKKERIEYWLKVGAQPSDRVHNLLVSEGILKAKKRPVHAKSKKKKGEPEPSPVPSAAPPAKPAETEPETKPAKVKKEEKPAPAKPEAKPAQAPTTEAAAEKPAQPAQPAKPKEKKPEDKK